MIRARGPVVNADGTTEVQPHTVAEDPPVDVNVAIGNLVDLVATQGEAYAEG